MKKIPKNLPELKKRIRKYVVQKPSKSNVIDYNKKYRTHDWSKPLKVGDMKEILQSKSFHSYDWLIKNERIYRDLDGNIDRNSVFSELFKREIAFQLDDIYRSRNRRAKKHNRMRYKKGKETYIKIGKRRFYLGKLQNYKRIPLIKEYLLKNSFVFDKSHPYGLNGKEIRKMIREKLLYGNIEHFDLLEYIRDLR